ncbi:EamA family transporter [Jatrophihabitans telluris]|uniref:EamA family transporter n=1 Tax=Jatrophihabitans telluris TaxID=2038343 RepID=A0ABY4R116_9ACTN|nr:EamA family transporter [Jatrophihabitans telluris]UQX89459.1 EamA family transporter [Jatrophihabitans telluris]
MPTTTPRDIALTALGPAIWGTSYYATTTWLPANHPLLDGAFRALPAGVLLIALRWQRPTGVWIWRIAVLGLLNIGLFFPLLFLAAERIPGGVAGAIGAAQPLLVLLLSAGLLGSRITTRALLTSLVGVAGVCLLVLRATGSIDPIGVAASASGTALMGVAIVLAKRWGPPPMPATTFTGWMLTAGGLVLTPTALLVEGWPAQLSATNYFGLFYLAAISGGLSYYLWMRGMAILPASAISFLSLAVPLVAASVGWLALGQHLNGVQLAGMALALGSMVAGQRVGARTSSTPDRRTTLARDSARMAGCPPAVSPIAPARQETSSSRLVGAFRRD